MVRCKSCKTDKPETEFYANKTMKSGRDNKCKDCKREYRPIRRRFHYSRKRVLSLKELFGITG